MPAFGRFLRNASGSISIMFALVLVAILSLAGATYDLSRAYQARAVLQAAADGAALAAGADETMDKVKMNDLAKNYLNENTPPAAVVKLGTLTTDFDAATKTISATVTGEASTAFLSLVGIPSVAITAVSQVKRSEPGPLELVLALDTTGSMNETLDGRTKIATLKTAAVNLVNTVMASPYAKVGVVPFSAGMNIGTEYKDKFWVFPAPDTTVKQCSSTGGSGYSCTTSASYACMKDGVSSTCTNTTCTWAVPPVTTCIDKLVSWNGCVSVRKNYEASIDSPGNPKYPWTGNMCPQTILNLSAGKSTVTAKINALSASLDTYIPIGLVWAWNMLTPDEPLTSARSNDDMAEIGGKKVIVLMTDGMNTLFPSYNSNGSTSLYTISSPAKQAEVDNTLKQLCTNVKKDGIIVYTVAFAVTDANIKNILRNCASDTGKYFDASDSAGLTAAFTKIGESLQRLRITK